MNTKELFDKLQSSGICGSIGRIYFELQNIKTAVKDKSVVGNIVQEWLKDFMKHNGINYRIPSNSQEFPDYYMNKNKDDIDLLEVKCFYHSPNFDVANFSAYCRSLISHPYRLDADYLIFEYDFDDVNIIIKNIWLKKVWEICGGSERSDIKLQWKQNVIYNIRPTIWYSKNTKYPPFETRLDFVLALKKVLDVSSFGGEWRNKWFHNLCNNYLKHTGNDL